FRHCRAKPLVSVGPCGTEGLLKLKTSRLQAAHAAKRHALPADVMIPIVSFLLAQRVLCKECSLEGGEGSSLHSREPPPLQGSADLATSRPDQTESRDVGGSNSD